MKQKIVIIDDEEMIREVWGGWLRRNGYEVLTAREGQEGYELVEKEQPDVVLIDVLMPGIDGLELARKIRTNHSLSHIPIVLISGIYRDQAFKLQAKQIADDFIEKPSTPEEVEAKIKKIFSLGDDIEPEMPMVEVTPPTPPEPPAAPADRTDADEISDDGRLDINLDDDILEIKYEPDESMPRINIELPPLDEPEIKKDVKKDNTPAPRKSAKSRSQKDIQLELDRLLKKK